MSLRVLVIPEDFRKDQYVLKPLIEAMFRFLGKPRAHVRVCRDPLLGSVSQALKWSNIEDIIDRYGMVGVFILCVDRDGDPDRRAKLDHLVRTAADRLSPGRAFFAEHAWQELEVWVLAGHNLPAEWSWSEIRAEVHPKERYYEPFARLRRVMDEPAEGRGTLAKEAAASYVRLRARCQEDVGALEAALEAHLKENA